jgi:phosphoribosylaminoimidazole carboxylase PurE protein
VTPTTKGDVDELITEKQIIDEGHMTASQWTFIKGKALELFDFGQLIASQKGLILVDTKYEFGLDINNNILLIDEVHTCDSSRYWLKNTYESKFNLRQEPDKFDKDMIREYVISKCDPYKDALPIIPSELITKTSAVYNSFLRMLIGEDCDLNSVSDDSFESCIDHYYNEYHKQMVVIMAGSERDVNWINTIIMELNKFKIYSKVHIASAHRNTQDVLNNIKKYNAYTNRQIIIVTIAGLTNALGGTVAAQCKYPVFTCPPFKDNSDMQVNIWSSIINPANVPTITMLNPINLAIAINKVFSLM